MNEQLLLYLWQYQQFDKQSLTLDTGSNIEIIFPGINNANQANCFLNAVIKIDNVLWKGSVLVNIKLSDWVKHQNEYVQGDNVLVHIVWENDDPDLKMKKPVLSLKSKVSSYQLGKAQHWINVESLALWGRFSDNHEVSTVKEDAQVHIKDNKEANTLNENMEPDFINCDNENQPKGNDDETKIIDCLHTLLESFKKKAPIIKGEVRSLKIIAWQRDTIRYYMNFGDHAKYVPKILLLGDWLTKAGFSCDGRVNVIPLTNMLIIIPQKQ